MSLLMNFLDTSKKLNQTPPLHLPPYHPQQKQYQIIHQGLMIPNLPAPLHYFNFLSIIGQPNVPMLLNRSALINKDPKITATTIASISPHMSGHLNAYDINSECTFRDDLFQFSKREKLIGKFPNFQFIRDDPELSVHLNIKTTSLISHFTKLKLPIFDHWSILCECEGLIHYKGMNYTINQLGSFEYARAISLPYLPLSFFSYQIINLNQHKQLLLAQIRNSFNQILQSRIYIRDLQTLETTLLDQNVRFFIHRVYPAVVTPNHQKMYLPREFEWQYQSQDFSIRVIGQSRGDYKFGLAAGYVGSFQYQVEINQESYKGDGGYCEYIDCRPLKWQEQDKNQKQLEDLANNMPILAKK